MTTTNRSYGIKFDVKADAAGVNSLATAMESLATALEKIENINSVTSQINKAKSAVIQLNEELAKTARNMNAAGKESVMKQTNINVNTLSGDKKNVDKITDAISGLANAEAGLAKQRKQALIDEQNLTSVQSTGAARHTADLAKQKALVQELNAAQGQLTRQTSAAWAELNKLFLVQSTLQTFGTPLKGAGDNIISSFKNYEDQLQSVRRTTLSVGESSALLEKQLAEVIGTVAMQTDKITEIATAGGAANVPKDMLGDYTKAVAMFADSTEVSSEKAALSLARIFQLTNSADKGLTYEDLASAIFKVGNESASTADQVLNITTRLAPMAAQFGIATKDILALGSSLSTFGIEAQLGATSMQRSFAAIATGVTKGGDQLQLMGQISNMSAEAFAAAWEDKPMEAFALLIEGMDSAEYGGTQFYSTLKKLGLGATRDGRTWAALASNMDEFRRQQSLAGNELASGAELQELYAQRTKTVQQQLERLNSQLTVMAYEGLESAPLAESLFFLNDALAAVNNSAANGNFLALYAQSLYGVGGAAMAIGGRVAELVGTFLQLKAMVTIINIERARSIAAGDAEIGNLQTQAMAVQKLRIELEELNAAMLKKEILQNANAAAVKSNGLTGAVPTATLTSGLVIPENIKKDANDATKGIKQVTTATSAMDNAASKAVIPITTVGTKLGDTGEAAEKSGGKFAKLKGSIGAASSALSGLGTGIAIAAAITAILALGEAIASAISTADELKRKSGDFDLTFGTANIDVSAAIKEDTNEYMLGADKVSVFKTAIEDVSTALSDNEDAANSAAMAVSAYGDKAYKALINQIQTAPSVMPANEEDPETIAEDLRKVSEAGGIAKGGLTDLFLQGKIGAQEFQDGLGDVIDNLAEVIALSEKKEAWGGGQLEKDFNIIDQGVDVSSLLEQQDAYALAADELSKLHEAEKAYGLQQSTTAAQARDNIAWMADVGAITNDLVKEMENAAWMAQTFGDALGDGFQKITGAAEELRNIADTDKMFYDMATAAEELASGQLSVVDAAERQAKLMEYIAKMPTMFEGGAELAQGMTDALYILGEAGITSGAEVDMLNQALYDYMLSVGAASLPYQLAVDTKNAANQVESLSGRVAEYLRLIQLAGIAAQGRMNANLESQARGERGTGYGSSGAYAEDQKAIKVAKELAAATTVSAKATNIAGQAHDDYAKSVGGSTKAQKENVRSILDYVSDIEGIIKTMNDLTFGIADATFAVSDVYDRIKEKSLEWSYALNDVSDYVDDIMTMLYAGQNSQDSIASSFNDIKESIMSARDEWKMLNDEMADLRAEENQLQALARIAKETGDLARYQELQGKISQNKTGQATNAASAQETQIKMVYTTVGDSQSAIENREQIEQLLESYLQAIVVYAEGGKTQEETAAYTAMLSEKFAANAKEIGLNESEVSNLTKAFGMQIVQYNNVNSRMSEANDLLKDAVTSEQDLIKELVIHGASQAEINRAVAEAKVRLSEAAVQLGVNKTAAAMYTSAIDGVAYALDNLPKNITIDLNLNNYAQSALQLFLAKARDSAYQDGKLIGNGYGSGIGAGLIDRLRTSLSGAGSLAASVGAGGVGRYSMYSTGGYTGSEMGIVHPHEYVINAESTKLYRPILEAMNQNKYAPSQRVTIAGGGETTLSRKSVNDLGTVMLAGLNSQVVYTTDTSVATANSRYQTKRRVGSLR